MLDGVADEPALLAQLEVDVILVVLALDVWHVDGDEDVRRLLLQPQQRQDNGREVRRVTRGLVRVGLGRLCRDEGVGGQLGAVREDGFRQRDAQLCRGTEGEETSEGKREDEGVWGGGAGLL